MSVALATRSSKGERYVVGDITSTGLADGSQDIIVYSGVLHHFTTRTDRSRVLREGFRILAPSGRLFSYDPNAHSPSMWLYRDPRSPFFSDKGKTENEVLLKRDELRAELRMAGFNAVRIRGTAGMTFRYVAGTAARFLIPAYNLYERALRYSPFEDRLGTFLVCVGEKPG